jgi:TPP-dependent pyruvate/acetoin dehydrogenase alpha subunit
MHWFVVQVDGMDCLAVKQAVKFAKEYALKNGPMVSSFKFKKNIII